METKGYLELHIEGSFREVQVSIEYEYDYGYPVKVVGVELGGVSIMELVENNKDMMAQLELAAIEDIEYRSDMAMSQAEDAADHRYEQMKDRRYEESQRHAHWCVERGLA